MGRLVEELLHDVVESATLLLRKLAVVRLWDWFLSWFFIFHADDYTRLRRR